MARPFPENDVEVLRRNLPDDLHAALQRSRTELTQIYQVTNVLSSESFEFLGGPLDATLKANQDLAYAVNEARGKLVALLTRLELGIPEKPPYIITFDEITDEMMRHELPGALEHLTTYEATAPPIEGLQLDRATLDAAWTAAPSPYLVSRVTKIINTPNGPKEIRVRDEHMLPGYNASARLTNEQIDQVFTLLAFLGPTRERRFRLGIMRGEITRAVRQHDAAIAAFTSLLYTGHRPGRPVRDISDLHGRVVHGLERHGASETHGGGGHHGTHHVGGAGGVVHDWVADDDLVVSDGDTEPPPITAEERFAALRLAFTHLGRGDDLFRARRVLDDTAAAAVRTAYIEATAVVSAARHSISTENPLRQQVERYAALQVEKLDGRLNFLGYRDDYVPVLRPSTLQALAERRVAAAAEMVQKFDMFKSRADQLMDQLGDLDFQQDVKAKELAIADEQVAKARSTADIAARQVEHIGHQLEVLGDSALTGVGGLLLQGAAAAALAGSPGGGLVGTSLPGVAGAVAGLATTRAEYLARKDELAYQQEIARIEASVARRDIRIAELGKQIAETTLEFLDDRVRRIKHRELSPDLYYAAGESFRALAERHMDAAILWSYLFERSVAFLRIEPTLRKVALDYANGAGGLLAAPDALRADLSDVIDLNLPITKFQYLTETYSLRSLYPLDFNRFLQTGRMDFAMSLYELNKRRPGVHRQRIKRVQVELQFPPPSGFTGRIRHRGSFLLRDRESTLQAGQATFMPTAAALAESLGAMGTGATQGVAIGGVIPFQLDVDTLELSPNEATPELGEPSPDTLAPIEGYGPAGTWTLEIENVDLRFITDVLLKITYVIPESDEPLSIRVKTMIAQYEQQLLQGDTLDLISAMSLRQRFPDAFSRLASGSAAFTAGRDAFPSGVKNLRLKYLVAQVLDAQKRGLQDVAIALSKTGTAFTVERTTRADGFTEDLTAQLPSLPPADRVPVEGEYSVRLLNPAQAASIAEVLLFFVYQVEEA